MLAEKVDPSDGDLMFKKSVNFFRQGNDILGACLLIPFSFYLKFAALEPNSIKNAKKVSMKWRLICLGKIDYVYVLFNCNQNRW